MSLSVLAPSHFAPSALNVVAITKQLPPPLGKVHYHMAIMCDICKSFASMSAQVVLYHHASYMCWSME